MKTLETIINESGGNQITSIHSTALNRWIEIDLPLTKKTVNAFAALGCVSHIAVEHRDYRIGELTGLPDGEFKRLGK